jgi:hypothetical protein
MAGNLEYRVQRNPLGPSGAMRRRAPFDKVGRAEK